MVFNSLEFFIFLFIVFILYWFLFKKSVKKQNILLLIASYVFYGWWDWRFLSLIILSTTVDYFVGIMIDSNNKSSKRKLWLWCSVAFNVGLLGFFKYYNFFVDSWIDMFSLFGYNMGSTWTLKVILPVGISFYTFQTMSYSFDIYYKKLKPTKDYLSFAAFVSFFPQLVAGPIERATNLLSQIITKRTFSYNQSVSGLKLILWGLFKKVVIADALAPIVNDIFANYSDYSASTLIMGVTLFSFQIYGDFSGYSDIAIGTAKLFGIELMSNFKFPYFSRNIAEFWRRWHISLSTWFRYYIYIPLGGSHHSKWISLKNITIVFLVSGFWHGANWTYIFWGALHALAFIPVFLIGKNKIYKDSIVGENRLFPSIVEVFKIIKVFSLVTFSWIFFRSESIMDAFNFIYKIITDFSFETYLHPKGYRMIDYYVLLIVFVLYEYIIRKDERTPFKFKSKFTRFVIYTLIIFTMLLFYDSSIDRSFIYFQF
ncbi:MBOAT family O-acyltransferase [Flavivirga rizhaonensis]|uniref:MBOAT family protein n=1 Tax=Flavivirga rizhaonensis TaxID=2559571 RepID=A0A4S1DZW4_9FLAO|nr:MBOAT family O-acyltransferase [Flavivirga rizhaonensis]TGV03921.1 MBOAT family protein [Flavivirga rizhaonensis]